MTTTTKESRIRALELAISRGNGVVKFCRALGITTQAIYHWKKRGWVPADKALVIESIFGVPREDMIEPTLLKLISEPYKPAEDIL